MADYFFFNSRDEFHRLDIAKIMYFEADGNYTHIVMANKLKSTVGISLTHMEKALEESLHEKARCFVRIGKSCIINVNHLARIDVPHQQIVITDYTQGGYQINASKEALKTLKSIMTESVKGNKKPNLQETENKLI